MTPDFPSGDDTGDTSTLWLKPSPIQSPTSLICSGQLEPDGWLKPSPIQSPTSSICSDQLEPDESNFLPGTVNVSLDMDYQSEQTDGPDQMREDQMDVDTVGAYPTKNNLAGQDKSCKFHIGGLCICNRSDQFQAWVLEPKIAHLQLLIGKGTLRVSIHKDSMDNLFHCTCGLKLDTVDAVQKHGRENQDEDHPTDFFSLFANNSNEK